MRAAITRDHGLGDLENKSYFLGVLEASSEKEVSAGLVSSVASLLG